MFTYLDGDVLFDTMDFYPVMQQLSLTTNGMAHVVYSEFRWFRDSTTAAGFTAHFGELMV